MRLSTTIKSLALASLLALAPVQMQAKGTGSFTVGKGTFLLNGEPFVVKAAELHYPRIPRPYWEHRIKMCKALGMNTVCLYVFWNIHEQQEGVFDFTGNNDVAEFCRLAQKNGMYVIVRPGPYVCAEWEMGGLPWWLLKKKDIRLREQDPYFMERVKVFEQKVGEQLASLTIQNGGPIIMVQVENEYGSYGEDKAYVSAIRDIVKASGFDKVTLFQCDWSSNFTKNGLDDLTWTMNFGTGANIDEQFKRLGELRPDAPKMCSEFWSGWFDKWGARHETRTAKDMVDGLDEMLSKGISFSLYMTHGGTSFGHWAGANSPGFAPDVTSYDYDAPINEYGQATPKFYELRTMMQKYSDKKLPSVPKMPAALVSFPQIKLTEFAPLIYGVDSMVVCKGENGKFKTFEDMNFGWGSMLYQSVSTPEIPTASTLTLKDCHDFATVYVDGEFIGTVDRTRGENSVKLPPLKKNALISIYVEGMGRINFGRAIKDYKGITSEATISTVDANGNSVSYSLGEWVNWRIKDNYKTALDAFEWQKSGKANAGIAKDDRFFVKESKGAGYYRGHFTLKKLGDTFINMERWGKGQVYVNGHAVGRFWRIGPQQTLYVPSCWLKKGQNEIVVLDVLGPKETLLWGQDTHELNKLQTEQSNLHNNPGDRPDLNSATPAAKGSFKAGNGWQTVKFASKQTGQYVAIECLNAQDGNEKAAIAELYLLDQNGKRLSREPWKAKYADSEDADNGNKTLDKVYDLQESTYWQTVKGSQFPHLIVIDLGSKQTVTALEYLPRAEQGAPASVKDYRIYVY